MPLPIQASISVPLGYRALSAYCIQRKTDMILVPRTSGQSYDPRQIGMWEVTPHFGFRVDHTPNPVIRSIRR